MMEINYTIKLLLAVLSPNKFLFKFLVCGIMADGSLTLLTIIEMSIIHMTTIKHIHSKYY